MFSCELTVLIKSMWVQISNICLFNIVYELHAKPNDVPKCSVFHSWSKLWT